MSSKKKPLPDGGKVEDIIAGAAALIEHAALVAISERLARLFEDPAFEADLLAATGKKKASQRYLDDVAEDIKERVLKDIARIYNEGLY